MENPNVENTVRQCPYCKEDIKRDAIRCKHCRSALMPEKPAHGGVCPFCKEIVNPEAIKCKHCGSTIGAAGGSKAEGDCGCGKTAIVSANPYGFSLAPLAARSGPVGGGSAVTSGVGIALGENCGDCYPLYRGGSASGGVKLCCTVIIGPFGVPMLSCHWVRCGPEAG